MRRLAVALVCAVLPAQTVPAPPAFSDVRDHVKGLVRGGAAPAIAVGVVQAGELVWAEGFGYADLEAPRPATADTVFRLASISKPVTATALMVLVDRGKLDLDAPANRHLERPGLVAHAGRAEDITLSRLASHTGGLPEHWCFYYDGVAPLPVAQAVRRYGFAAWRPGTRWSYSNLGFGILGHVVERVSGTPFGTFLEKEVLDPAGMRRTALGLRPGTARHAATPYARGVGGRWIRVTSYAFDHPGASAVRSTVNDLARFVMLHLDDGRVGERRVLSAESARAMRRLTGVRSPGKGTGIGWSIGSRFGRASFGHGGFMPGVSTRLQVFPDERHALIVLTNADQRAVTSGVVDRIGRVLFPDHEAGRSGRPPWPGKDPAPFTGRWTGTLAHPDGRIPLTLEVAKERASLTLGRDGREVRDLDCRDPRLRGHLPARIATIPGFHGQPRLHLDLERKGDAMTGVAIARVDGYFALAHWVTLRRAK